MDKGGHMIAEVLVEVKAKGIDKTFSYRIPEGMSISVGMRVLVPFGKQEVEGFVLKMSKEEVEYDVKEILSVMDKEPILNEGEWTFSFISQ